MLLHRRMRIGISKIGRHARKIELRPCSDRQGGVGLRGNLTHTAHVPQLPMFMWIAVKFRLITSGRTSSTSKVLSECKPELLMIKAENKLFKSNSKPGLYFLQCIDQAEISRTPHQSQLGARILCQ